MTSKQLLFNSFLESSYSPEDRSAQSWVIIFSFIILISTCYFTSATNLLRIIFPVSSFVVGIFLYLRHPILYLGFTWWIWFITPLLARLIDYRVGWDPTRQIFSSTLFSSTYNYCFSN